MDYTTCESCSWRYGRTMIRRQPDGSGICVRCGAKSPAPNRPVNDPGTWYDYHPWIKKEIPA